MINSLLDWLDHRTGFRHFVHDALYENIPSGARLRYITGSMLVFAFVVQAITGIFLALAYSPSSQTAYESVYYIQHEMTGGWLVRGIHHFMAQAMVVVMALHLLQVIWDGAYRAPREVNYWLGLILMQLVLGLGLTGYLLPWDQKGFWATNVATNLATLVPFVGKELQQVAVGGDQYGHHTLTRFYAMHMGVLPALLVIFLGLHVAMFRKHGIMATITPGRADEHFWPKQVLFDAIGCLVLLVIVLFCVIHFDVAGLVQGKFDVARAGAELGAPADPAEQYSAARPEWYYLFLFQLLKYFHGTQEYIGALVIPGVVMTILFLMPFVGRLTVGHWFNRAFIVFVLAAAGVLTALAFTEDYFVHVARWMKWDSDHHPKWLFAGTNDKGKEVDNFDKTLSTSRGFLKAREDAEKNSHRIVELVNRREMRDDGKLSPPLMIQRHGAVDLIRNDPLTQGPRLFGQHCASCHEYADPSDPTGEKGGVRFTSAQSPLTAGLETVKRNEKGELVYDDGPSGATNLFAFASRQWIRGFLDKDKIVAIRREVLPPSTDKKISAMPDHPDNHKRRNIADYFGNTAHREGRMVKWAVAHAELLKDDPNKPDDDVDAIAAALSAQARLRSEQNEDAKDSKLIEDGVAVIQKNCTNECHRFGDSGQLGLAPDLTGYGSYEWMMGLVSDPTHERFYRRENDRMPSFAAHLDQPAKNAVSVRELSLIVDWLRGEFYRPDDERPVLSHGEEQARLAAHTSRTVAEPRLALVGSKPTNRQRAEALFARNCSACHSRADASGRGIVAKNPTAPNLHGFASRAWLAGLLDANQFAGDNYFGKTAHFEGEMAGFVRDNLGQLDDQKKTNRDAIIAALSAEAALPAQAEADKKAQEDGTLQKGKAAIAEMWDTASCVDCHKFHDQGDLGAAPELTGYGTKDWIVKMITDPSHEAFYADKNDRMPSFGVDPPGAKKSLLSAEDIELLARWLRGEDVDAAAPAATAAASK